DGHQIDADLEAEGAHGADVLRDPVDVPRVGGDAHHGHGAVGQGVHGPDRAHGGDDHHGQLGAGHVRQRGEVLGCAVRRRARGGAGLAAGAAAVADLDDVDAGGVQGGDDGADVGGGELPVVLVPAVAQGAVEQGGLHTAPSRCD